MQDSKPDYEVVALGVARVFINRYPESAIGLAFLTHALEMHYHALKNIGSYIERIQQGHSGADWDHDTIGHPVQGQ